MFADDFVGRVTLESLRARVPAEDESLGIEGKDGVLVDAFDEESMKLAGFVRNSARRLFFRGPAAVKSAAVDTCESGSGGLIGFF